MDNLIISHLWSTSMDAPSLHQAAHCRDRASGAGRPVDFPLSLLQRGPASPYISRSGHADFRGHPSAATNETTQLCPKDQKNYILVQDHGHIYMLSSLTCRWRSSSVSMVFYNVTAQRKRLFSSLNIRRQICVW